MRNRNGTESNGYFGSSDHCEDIAIADGDHIADTLTEELFGIRGLIRHRIEINLKLLYWRIRRSNHAYYEKKAKMHDKKA